MIHPNLRRKPGFWLLMTLTLFLFGCEDDCTAFLFPELDAGYDFPSRMPSILIQGLNGGAHQQKLDATGKPTDTTGTPGAANPIDFAVRLSAANGAGTRSGESPRGPEARPPAAATLVYFADITANAVG